LHPDWKGRAVVVDRMDSRLTIMLPDLAYEYKLRYGGNMELNSEWQAAVNVVDLPALTAQFTISASQANKIEIPESS
jgi:exoribonuclease-2